MVCSASPTTKDDYVLRWRLWNGNDPILKERSFGLTNNEGNHGEDVKEYYYYLDSTPTHSYCKALYKYPQRAFPYEQLVRESAQRGRHDQEFELMDTGVFTENRYFDIVVEYAKASPNDILIRLTATNRGDEPAPLHILPTLWFRNDWSWGRAEQKPSLVLDKLATCPTIRLSHPLLGEYFSSPTRPTNSSSPKTKPTPNASTLSSARPTSKILFTIT